MEWTKRFLAAGFAVSTALFAQTPAENLRGSLLNFYDRNPRQVSVGVAHVERYSLDPSARASTVISVVVPSLPSGLDAHLSEARLGDVNTRGPHDPWPDRFAITDGDPSAQMVVVDQSAGSALSQQLDIFIEDMRERGVVGSDPEAVIRELRDHTQDYFRVSPKNLVRNLEADVLEKSEQSLSEAAQAVFRDFKGKPISGDVWPTPDKRPALPFEHYLAYPQETLCFHYSLLASLVLQRLGIPNNLRAGFTSELKSPFKTTGHTLIVLGDGRLLDPTWKFVKPVQTREDYRDWIAGKSWWWKPYAHFPFLILQ